MINEFTDEFKNTTNLFTQLSAALDALLESVPKQQHVQLQQYYALLLQNIHFKLKVMQIPTTDLTLVQYLFYIIIR
jgi:hypothetical protein